MVVSFAVVTYNGEKTLPHILEDLCNQEYPHEKIEVLLIDSLSTDKTAEIMKAFAAQHTEFLRVKVLENPGKTLPFGCNVGLRNAEGDVFVRLDAHARIPSDYLSCCMAQIEAGEDICGGLVKSLPESDTPWQKTLLKAENSAFCGGVAGFRRMEERAYVSTLAFAMYRMSVYKKVGFYNENLARTEDNEMNYRIREAGYKFCFDPSVSSTRFSRGSLSALLRQKYLNGYWIGLTMGVCPKCFSLYHFVPFAFVLGVIFTTLLALLGIPQLAALMWALYGLMAVAMTVVEIVKDRFYATDLLLPVLFLLLHINYGWGTLVGLLKLPFWLKKIRQK